MKTRTLVSFTLLTLTIMGVGATLGLTPVSASPANGRVYIMTDATSNQIIVYNAAPDGTLTWLTTVNTNGLGTGGHITGSNQGGLTLTKDGTMLLVVNAGSNEVSTLQVTQNGLTFTGKISSSGLLPISVTEHNNIVYVLDAGNTTVAGNIAGFALSNSGHLTLLTGSIQPLSGITAPAQVSFNPAGTALVVTEKSTNLIDTYTVDSDGVASTPTTHASSGATPFGFAFDKRGNLIVSEAGGGPSGTSAVSSYSLSGPSGLTTLTDSIPDTQLAACWLVVTGNGKYAYTTNAHSGTISSYKIASDGTISLSSPIAANTSAGDIDMALNHSSNFLYVSIISTHSIEGFRVNGDGTLTLIGTVSGLPAGANGLAAF